MSDNEKIRRLEADQKQLIKKISIESDVGRIVELLFSVIYPLLPLGANIILWRRLIEVSIDRAYDLAD